MDKLKNLVSSSNNQEQSNDQNGFVDEVEESIFKINLCSVFKLESFFLI
jgi:hypothetical protein